LKNFWPDVNCDIEQHIYLLPIGEIQSLHNAIWSNDKFLLKRNKNKYANILYLRFLCNAINSDETDKIIHKYAMYRYGGKMKINKSDIDSTYEEGVYNKSFHRTYKELLTAIDDNCVDEESTYLMNRLKSFYEKSVIFQLSGTELMNLPERV